MTTLEQLQCSASFTHHLSSTEVSGIRVSSSETTELTVELPKKPAVQASFATENLARKFLKLFQSELQTGDRSFDDAVYIRTTTPEATAAWLASERVRATIAEHVAAGTVQIHEAKLILRLGDHVNAAPPDVVELVRSLLA